MIKGKCIYCRAEKDLNREHAFPKSLLQKGMPEWIIDNHLCKTCNSNLGKLDVVLSKRSPLAYIWERLQDELGQKAKALHSSIYDKRAAGINPMRLFLSNSVYDDHIILHEPETENSGISACINSMTPLHPQMVLMQYPKGQTCAEVVAENLEKFNTISSDEDFITDYDEQEDVYCIFGNTYIFPPKASERFFGSVAEFKSMFMKDHPRTRYDLQVILPEEGKYQGTANAFCASFKAEAK